MHCSTDNIIDVMNLQKFSFPATSIHWLSMWWRQFQVLNENFCCCCWRNRRKKWRLTQFNISPSLSYVLLHFFCYSVIGNTVKIAASKHLNLIIRNIKFHYSLPSAVYSFFSRDLHVHIHTWQTHTHTNHIIQQILLLLLHKLYISVFLLLIYIYMMKNWFVQLVDLHKFVLSVSMKIC